MEPAESLGGIRPRTQPVPGAVEFFTVRLGYLPKAVDVEDAVEDGAVQGVDRLPRPPAVADLGHRRVVPGGPSVGRCRPVRLQAPARTVLGDAAGQRAADINHRAEHIEGQYFHRVNGHNASFAPSPVIPLKTASTSISAAASFNGPCSVISRYTIGPNSRSITVPASMSARSSPRATPRSHITFTAWRRGSWNRSWNAFSNSGSLRPSAMN